MAKASASCHPLRVPGNDFDNQPRQREEKQMKIQSSFAVIVLALVAILVGCKKTTPTQEQVQPAPEKTVPADTAKPAGGLEACKAKNLEGFSKRMEMRALHVIEDKTTGEDAWDGCRFESLTGYVKDDHGNCFFAAESVTTYGRVWSFATVPCDSLTPKK